MRTVHRLNKPPKRLKLALLGAQNVPSNAFPHGIYAQYPWADRFLSNTSTRKPLSQGRILPWAKTNRGTSTVTELISENVVWPVLTNKFG